MCVPLNHQRLEVRERKIGSRRCDLLGVHQTSQHLRDFDVNEVRRVQTLSRMQGAIGDALRAGCLQHQLHGRRGIEHDQPESRSSRSTWVGDSFPR